MGSGHWLMPGSVRGSRVPGTSGPKVPNKGKTRPLVAEKQSVITLVPTRHACRVQLRLTLPHWTPQ